MSIPGGLQPFQTLERGRVGAENPCHLLILNDLSFDLESVSGTHSLPQDIDGLLWMDLSGHSLYKQAACVEQASLQAHGRRFEGWTQRPPGRWPCWGACEVPRSDEGDRTFQMHPLLSAQQEHGEAEPGWPKQKEGWWLICRKSPGGFGFGPA